MDTLDVFDRQFSTDEACKDFLAAQRWPDGVRCPRCNAKDRVYVLKTRPYHWVCKSGAQTIDDPTGQVLTCDKRNGYRFSVISGTIFMDTKVPLRLWFKVGYLMLTAKKRISSLQVHRLVFGENSGSDWRTSWYMCHRWRAAMRGDAFPLTGVVEADETYIGGKDANRHWNRKSAQVRKAQGPQPFGKCIGYDKVGVIGAIARKGNIVCKVIGDQDARTLSGFVRNVVSDQVSLVVTDEKHDYKHMGLPHQFVNHSHGEYVRGNVHTNNIEGFWSLLKRGVVGTYHKVSKDYLPLYLNEFSFRFNNRKNPDMFADLIATCDN
jgi:transposase-like protein